MLESQLRQHLENLAIPRHPLWDPLGHQIVRNYIQRTFQQYGPVETQIFPAGQIQGYNLILKLPGQQPHRSPLLLGAHYDGMPGIAAADDNATGVAALLTLAATLANQPVPRPVWMVAFDLEEWGMLGGAALATILRQQQQPLHLMLSLEMLGFTSPVQTYPLPWMSTVYGNKGDYIALIGNLAAIVKLQMLGRSLNRHVPAKWLPVPNAGHSLRVTRLSDHSPFWDQGYDAVMVTDTAFLRNPHYHQPTDAIATLNLPFLQKVTEGMVAALAAL